MAAETETETEFGEVSRLKGTVFRYVNVVASWVGVAALVVLLAYVSYDALGLASAGPGWYATYLLTVGAPALAMTWYYYRDRAAGAVAVQSFAVVLGGVAAGFAVLVLFVVFDPAKWFTFGLTLGVPVGIVAAAGYGYGLPERPWARPALLPVAVAGVLLGSVATGAVAAAWAVDWAVRLVVVGGVLAAFVGLGARRPVFGRVGAYAGGAVVLGILTGYGLLGIGTIFGLGLPGSTVVYGAAVAAALVGVLAYFVRSEGVTGVPLAGVVVPFAVAGAALAGTALGAALAPIGAGAVAAVAGAIGAVRPGVWTVYFLTLVVPGALVAGRYARGHGLVEAGEGAANRFAVPAVVLAGALVGTLLVDPVAAATGIWPFTVMTGDIWLVFLLTLVVPTALFAAGTLRRSTSDRRGLAAPVVVLAGMVVGTVLADLLGAEGPEPWLDWQYVTSLPSYLPAEAGLYAGIIGSVFVIVLVALLSFPLGVGAAVYLEEYSPSEGRWGTLARIIQINISNLAGVPSVVYGLLGLSLFVNLIGLGFGTVVVAALTLSLLILPIVIISAQESIRAVPDSMREASYGMGATRWQTIRNVVLPRSLPGILTGTILALGRAIGETAPLILIGLPTSIFNVPAGPTSKTTAMPLQIFNWAFRPDPDFRHGVVAAGVVVLLLVLVTMNSVAVLVRNRYERRT